MTPSSFPRSGASNFPRVIHSAIQRSAWSRSWKHGQRVSSPRAQPHTHAPVTGRPSSSKPSAAALVTIAESSTLRSLAARYDSKRARSRAEAEGRGGAPPSRSRAGYPTATHRVLIPCPALHPSFTPMPPSVQRVTSNVLGCSGRDPGSDASPLQRCWRTLRVPLRCSGRDPGEVALPLGRSLPGLPARCGRYEHSR